MTASLLHPLAISLWYQKLAFSACQVHTPVQGQLTVAAEAGPIHLYQEPLGASSFPWCSVHWALVGVLLTLGATALSFPRHQL